jgi:hypothetical protein
MAWIMERPHAHIGKVVANGHCVRFIQEHASVPHTSQWRQGVKVRGNDVESGTCIATFSARGQYENRTDGSSHAAVFIEESDEGLEVIDQWRGQPVHRRTIHFRGNSGKAVNNGDRFHVIEEV